MDVAFFPPLGRMGRESPGLLPKNENSPRDQAIPSDDVTKACWLKPVEPVETVGPTPDEVCRARKTIFDYCPHRAHVDKSLEVPFKTEYDIVMQQQGSAIYKITPPSFVLLSAPY